MGVGSPIAWGSTRPGGTPSRRGSDTRCRSRQGNRRGEPAPDRVGRSARRVSSAAFLSEALARQAGLVAPRKSLDHHAVVLLRLIHVLEAGVGDPGLQERGGDLVSLGVFLTDLF